MIGDCLTCLEHSGTARCSAINFTLFHRAAAGPPEKQPVTNAAPADDDDDDDETCGFCIFMKAGGCKDVFKVRRHMLQQGGARGAACMAQLPPLS